MTDNYYIHECDNCGKTRDIPEHYTGTLECDGCRIGLKCVDGEVVQYIDYVGYTKMAENET